MKKFLFIFLSLLLVCETYAGGFKLIGGGNLSKYTLEPKESGVEWNYKMGYLAGGGIEFSLAPNVAIEIDGLYLQKGSKVKVSGYDAEINYLLDVISIPALLKIKFIPGTSPYILGGGEFSYILSHKTKISYQGEETEEDIKEEHTEDFDYGLVFGGGFEMSMPGASFFIEGRYHLGLRNIWKDLAEDEELTTNAIIAVVGIKI